MFLGQLNFCLLKMFWKHRNIKDDFQSMLCSLRTLMFTNIITAHLMELKLMLFVKNHKPYL